MKKILSILLASLLLIGALAVTASAENTWSWPSRPQQRTVKASFYLLNEGLAIPVGTASQPAQNYTPAGEGKIKITRDNQNGYYNADGVEEFIVSAPYVKLQAGQSIVWYVIKKEEDVWHVDGVITPFCSVLYDSNCDNATGATTDEQHYYKNDSAKVQENGFVRSGYTFTGWNTAADGSGSSYAPGDVITSENLVFHQSVNTITLYAQWKEVAPEKPEPEEPVGEIGNIRIDAALKMAVKFADGSVYYDGDMKSVVIGKEYPFQMCAVNWDTGVYDDDNGFAGSVVYTFKAMHKDEFNTLRAEAVKHPERYTVKGIDIIDNDAKTIVVNCDVEDFHLETDVNNFFVAYRFHFAKGDYNKQTGIKNVVDKPLESLSVNLPIGTTIRCDAYQAYEKMASEDIFVTGNNGEGQYADPYWTSVNDYTWKY